MAPPLRQTERYRFEIEAWTQATPGAISTASEIPGSFPAVQIV
jgi:hypothetical protein